MDDHYEALGLEPDATFEEIKKAFKALALQYHPDQHHAAAIFRRLNEAYKVLSDPKERQHYDELRRIRTSRRPAPRPAPRPTQSKARPRAKSKARPDAKAKPKPGPRPGAGPKRQDAWPAGEEPASERTERQRREGVHRYRYAKQRQKQARRVSRETVAENAAKMREILGDETED